jgi:hypothetical protein
MRPGTRVTRPFLVPRCSLRSATFRRWGPSALASRCAPAPPAKTRNDKALDRLARSTRRASGLCSRQVRLAADRANVASRKRSAPNGPPQVAVTTSLVAEGDALRVGQRSGMSPELALAQADHGRLAEPRHRGGQPVPETKSACAATVGDQSCVAIVPRGDGARRCGHPRQTKCP